MLKIITLIIWAKSHRKLSLWDIRGSLDPKPSAIASLLSTDSCLMGSVWGKFWLALSEGTSKTSRLLSQRIWKTFLKFKLRLSRISTDWDPGTRIMLDLLDWPIRFWEFPKAERNRPIDRIISGLLVDLEISPINPKMLRRLERSCPLVSRRNLRSFCINQKGFIRRDFRGRISREVLRMRKRLSILLRKLNSLLNW